LFSLHNSSIYLHQNNRISKLFRICKAKSYRKIIFSNNRLKSYHLSCLHQWIPKACFPHWEEENCNHAKIFRKNQIRLLIILLQRETRPNVTMSGIHPDNPPRVAHVHNDYQEAWLFIILSFLSFEQIFIWSIGSQITNESHWESYLCTRDMKLKTWDWFAFPLNSPTNLMTSLFKFSCLHNSDKIHSTLKKIEAFVFLK
jgi:hypothetical protein